MCRRLSQTVASFFGAFSGTISPLPPKKCQYKLIEKTADYFEAWFTPRVLSSVFTAMLKLEITDHRVTVQGLIVLIWTPRVPLNRRH